MTYLIYCYFNDPATPEIYTLSLHDALPISERSPDRRTGGGQPPSSDGLRGPIDRTATTAALTGASQQSVTRPTGRTLLSPFLSGPLASSVRHLRTGDDMTSGFTFPKPEFDIESNVER